MNSLYRTALTKRELGRKAKLSIYRLILFSTLTYGHEGWGMTERTRLRAQAAEMSFRRRVAGVALRDRVKSSASREELRLEQLLLCLERSELRWFGHLKRMPTRNTSLGRCFRHVQWGDLGEDPGLDGGGIISRHWPGNASGSPPSGQCGPREREVWVPLLELRPLI